MPASSRIHEDIRTRIRRDIRPFADPGSEVLGESDEIYWEKDGEAHTATLKEAPGDYLPSITMNGVDMTYRHFLASPHMADLHRLAEFMPKSLDHPEDYVDTRASLSDGKCSENADLLVTRLSTEELPYGSTRIILVRGEAGAGKTMAMRKMTIDRATEYRDGKCPSLFFYIDVQGRSLSRLDDAMARDLQDLRSRFSYSAVPPLVRAGLLVPVIDGFDELLGSGGYDEAFSSLAAFIAQLDGRGAVVASARSAFFDYNSFRLNAHRFSHDGLLGYQVDEVTIQPWDDEDADEFMACKAADHVVTTRFRGLRDQMPEGERHLLRKPFYVAQIASFSWRARVSRRTRRSSAPWWTGSFDANTANSATRTARRCSAWRGTGSFWSDCPRRCGGWRPGISTSTRSERGPNSFLRIWLSPRTMPNRSRRGWPHTGSSQPAIPRQARCASSTKCSTASFWRG